MMPVIARYEPSQVDQIVVLLGDAFVTNPLHIAAFGNKRLDLNRLFFGIALEHMFKSSAFVATLDDKPCGYMHFGAWPFCLPPADQVQAAGESILTPLGTAVPRVVEWLSTWCRFDPQEPHVHLGPIGVSPDVQGHGVGTALMNRYVEHLDQHGVAGYLETDRPENVGFYEKFRFVVQREQALIGTPLWYMWRSSKAAA